MVFDYVGGVRTVARLASFDGHDVIIRPLTKREMSADGAEQLLAAPEFHPEDPFAAPKPKRPSTHEVPAERKPYGADTKFEVGEWLSHPKFGAGLVTALLDGSRIRVAFSSEERVLVHCRG